jgi:hypothetical protein
MFLSSYSYQPHCEGPFYCGFHYGGNPRLYFKTVTFCSHAPADPGCEPLFPLRGSRLAFRHLPDVGICEERVEG